MVLPIYVLACVAAGVLAPHVGIEELKAVARTVIFMLVFAAVAASCAVLWAADSESIQQQQAHEACLAKERAIRERVLKGLVLDPRRYNPRLRGEVFDPCPTPND